MANTSVACETCRIVHGQSFPTQGEAELKVGDPHSQVEGYHRPLFVTTDSLADMLSDIYQGSDVPPGWKLGVLRVVAEQ